MLKNTVEIDFAGEAETFKFSPVFNMAPLFIDRHMAQGRADKTAILTTCGQKITYRALFENVNRAGNVIKSLGLRMGDRVLMVVKDCPEFYYLFWGAVKSGMLPVPINTILRAKDYTNFIENSECKLLVYSKEYSAEVAPAVGKSDYTPEHVIEIGQENNLFEMEMAKASDCLEPAETAADDDCFIVYSSGSTGNPKGAVHKHKSMVVTANRVGVQTLKIEEDDIFYSAAKLFFAYGMGNAMTLPLWCGGSAIICPDRPTPERVSDIVEEYRPTIFFGVPTLYAGQISLMETRNVDFTSVRICLSAGEGLPCELFHRWRKLTGRPPLDGIGSTENLNHFICNRIGDARPGCSGVPVPGCTAKIIDEKGNELPAGEIGELVIKSESAASRYWRNPEETAETFDRGWLHTGDTYYTDEDGRFFYCGRNDDMLKVGGIWCSPFEIEGKLLEHPNVLEAAVIGSPDDQNLIKPRAYLVLKDCTCDEDQLKEELKQLCKMELAPYKYPRWFVFLKELPKTATGKIQRFKLREACEREIGLKA